MCGFKILTNTIIVCLLHGELGEAGSGSDFIPDVRSPNEWIQSSRQVNALIIPKIIMILETLCVGDAEPIAGPQYSFLDVQGNSRKAPGDRGLFSPTYS